MRISIDIPACKILILDDHVLVTEGFRELLSGMLTEETFISTYSSIENAKESFKANNYKFLITDLLMPGQKPLEFISYCRKAYPDLIILVVSSVADVSSIKACLSAGVNGYLSKAVDLREIKLAMEYTYHGKKFISGDLSGRLADSILSSEQTSLTNKELEVLRLIAGGFTTKRIAEQLFISPVTVITHRRNVLRKLELHSSTELVKYAYDNDLT